MLAKELDIDIHAWDGMGGMISEGKYDRRHPAINDEEFPVPGGFPRHKVYLINFERSIPDRELSHWLFEMCLEHATIEKLLAVGARYPQEQLLHPILALGTISAVMRGWPHDSVFWPYAACLSSGGERPRPRVRLLDVCYLQEHWEREYWFLVERRSFVRPLLDIEVVKVMHPMQFVRSRAA